MIPLLRKTCSKCLEIKPIAFFAKRPGTPGGYRHVCRTCRNTAYRELRSSDSAREAYNAAQLVYYHRDKDVPRERRYKKLFGITIADYNRMFADQLGCCKICSRHQSTLNKRLDVDHDHKTKRVRGLLCNNCNRGLGHLKDSISNLQTAIAYLSEPIETIFKVPEGTN